MSIESELRKEGIIVIKQISTHNVNLIAKNIARKLTRSFSDQNFNCSDIFAKLSRLNMYIAKMPDGVAAKYFYKNSSIYFSTCTDLENLNEVAIHECIHAIQSEVNKKNKLIKLGLCDFTDSTLSGIALNEAAVQLMTMKAIGSKFDTVKYFDIELPSNSTDYYTLECNLVRQMAYITGEYVLYNSTLYGNDHFKNKFINLTSKKDFEIIKNNINCIMQLEDDLNRILQKIQNSNTITHKAVILMKKSNKLKKQIKDKFLLTQNKILTSFFDKLFNNIYSPKEIENFRKALYTYRKFIGVSDDYSFFSNYYITKMEALHEKLNSMSQKSLALIPAKNTLLLTALRKLKRLIEIAEAKLSNNAEIN